MKRFFFMIFFPLVIKAGNEQSTQLATRKDTTTNHGLQTRNESGQVVHTDKQSTTINLDKKNGPEQIVVNNINNTYTSAFSQSSSAAAAYAQLNQWQKIGDFIGKSPLPELFSHMSRNWKWYLIGSTYAVISALLIQGNRLLSNNLAWINWQSHLTVAQLQLIPHQELAKQLLQTIQLKYFNEQKPTDSISPLVQFIQDIKYEKKIVDRYVLLTYWLNKLWGIKKLFPFCESRIDRAKQAQERLNFINHIFISWATNYNLLQVQAA